VKIDPNRTDEDFVGSDICLVQTSPNSIYETSI